MVEVDPMLNINDQKTALKSCLFFFSPAMILGMKKAAIITGASSGIGAATAITFANNGYFVFLLGRNEERLHEVALKCKNGSSLLKADLTNEASTNKYIKHLYERPDVQIEVLINNAGIYQTHGFLDKGLDIWREQFEVNLFGPIRLTQGVIPLFQKNKKGSIVNISSGLGLRASGNAGAYSASKAAMVSWTQSMAKEFGPQGIRVNCVCPGLVDTPIHAFHGDKKILDSMGGLQPLGRLGTAEELAESIYFIGSDKSIWTTGAVLTVDGGINI